MGRQPYLGEGLLAPGIIRLFGREFKGLILGRDEGIDPASNNPLVLQRHIERLEAQIRALDQRIPRQEPPSDDAAAASPAASYGVDDTVPETAEFPIDESELSEEDSEQDKKDDEAEKKDVRGARLARIYGFSYLGSYFKMANPPVLRVFGPGLRVRTGFRPENRMDILGVEFKNEDFVRGIRMWPVDHLDVAVRIDITIGWLREILLDTDMSQDTNMTSNAGVSRADVVGRDSGLVGRDSGLVGRDSGLVGRDSGFAGRPRR